ncbi:MAG: phosphoribosylanthranilate isomerase [Pyrinomonadaceae bacterium]|nr:phosphoribosylanthranilate isomerase [Phycisphaerales bacterium]
MHPRIRLKVCCIASIAEAKMAIAAGADAIGLVARMPSGPGPISDSKIRAVAASVPPPVATFLLTCETEPDAVVRHVQETRVNTVQLVDDDVSPDVYIALRRHVPAVRIVQVIHVRDRVSVDRAIASSQHVDLLLLDSGNPAASVRELGGTGRAHDWQLSREIVVRSPVPVFLAGGLNAGNIAEAVSTVRPFGVDLCSGVRTNGKLDAEKLRMFVASLTGAIVGAASHGIHDAHQPDGEDGVNLR